MTNDSEVCANLVNPTADVWPPRRLRFQFSLATLLWLTTLAVCLAALLAMYRELRQARDDLRAARDEVQKYRGEMGFLDVTDRSKIYARGLKIISSANKWSWRVFVPQGRQFRLLLATSGIPATGFAVPEDTEGLGLPPGESLIDASVDSSELGWRIQLDSRHEFHTHMERQIQDPGAWISSSVVGEKYQIESGAREGLALLRVRKDKTIAPGSNVIDTQPCDGFMIWIEEVK